MLVRSDSWSVVSIDEFAFENSASLAVDKAALEIRGVWYRLGNARIELAFERRRIRGNGRYAGGTLEVEVRAIAPLRARQTTVVVQGEGAPRSMLLELDGAPAVLAQRIVCEVKDIPKEGPRSVDVALSIPNDGGADCRGGSLRIAPLTDGAEVESVRRDLRLSLAYDRQRRGAVLVPFEAAVGETAQYVATIVVEPGVAALNLAIDVFDRDLLCHFETGNVSLSQRETAFVLESDATYPVVPMRAGVIATIEHRSGEVADARLEVNGLHIMPATIALGRLLPDEIRRFPFDVRFGSADAAVQSDDVTVSLLGPDGPIATAQSRVTCIAPDSIAAKVQYGAVGDRGDVDVFVTVANTGFGPSLGLSLSVVASSEICFVADSLLIDAEPGAGMDGRWDASLPIRLPTIHAGARTEVRFTVRSSEAQRAQFEVAVRDESGGSRVRLDVAIDVPAYRAGSATEAPLVIAAPVQEALLSEGADSKTMQEESPSPVLPAVAEDPHGDEASAGTEDRERAKAAAESQPGQAPEESAEEDGELSAEAIEFYGDGNVALGRHVLVVLSRAPESFREAVAALYAQYLPGLRAGAFALSGHAYDSAALRAAVAAVLEGAGESLAPDAPASFVLARAMALCALSGHRSESFKQYRDEVVVAVLKAKTDEDFDAELVDRDLMGVAA